MKNEFDFYEIVRVNSKSSETKEINGLEGAVLGKAKNETGEWGYAVSIYRLDECWDIMHSELESTGRMDKEENFYDGTSVRVSVDPETGEGRIVDGNS